MAIDSAHANAAAARSDDAVFKIATSDQRGLSMLDDDEAVASQPTLSRLFAQLSSEANLPILRSALFDRPKPTPPRGLSADSRSSDHAPLREFVAAIRLSA